MPEPTKKKSGTMGFLTRKELGLPIWAWAIIVSVLMYLLYRYYKNRTPSSSTAASSTAPPDTTGLTTDPNAGGDVSSGDTGGGTPASDTSQGLEDIAGALQGLGVAPYYDPGLYGGQGFFDTSGVIPEGTNPSGTTPVAGVYALNWGNTNYTTRAQFNAYLKSKGISAAQFAAMHPAAYAHYLALPAGVTQTKATKKSTVKPTTATKTGTRTIATQAAKKVTAVSKTLRPNKAAVSSGLKNPVRSSPLLQGKVGNVTSTFLQPSSLVRSPSPSASKKVVPNPSPVKAPAKTTEKPTPVTRQVATKPAAAKPPAKRRK